jgi:uncharacterized membrane protein
MIGRLVFVLGLLGCAAGAETPLPGTYFVADVAMDDVLNIRAAPSADSAIIGSYSPLDMNVEVLETTPDGNWGLVGRGEGNGWVSMRFLRQQDQIAGSMPRPMICMGTEPFWTVGIYPGGDEYLTPEGRLDLIGQSETVRADGYDVVLDDPDGGEWTVSIRAGACSDGMSDRRFGWTGLVIRPDGSQLSGCCTLDSN